MYEISMELDKAENEAPPFVNKGRDEAYKLVQDIVDAHNRCVNLRAIFSGEGLTNSSV